jgi:hypothetical protein
MKQVVTILTGLLIAAGPAFAFKVTMSTNTEGGDKPAVIGVTNLPDGTELMVTVKRSESGYMAQSKVRVSNGSFRAGPFSQKAAPLIPGTYTVEISTPIAAVQSPSVRSVIGRDGSNLEGPLAKQSTFGGKTLGGKVVEYQTAFTVGGGKSSADADRAAKAQANQEKHEWWLKSCKDNCGLVEGVARSRGERFDWDTCYTKCLAEEPRRK